MACSKANNTGAWKGRLKRLFVNPKSVYLVKVISISVKDIQKINDFCFMYKAVAQKLSLTHPSEF